MKKFLFLAMAAAAMVSCSQNEEIENAAQKAEIKLKSVVKGSTKAAITTTDNLKEFKVEAYKTSGVMGADVALGNDKFMNVTVAKTDGTWGYGGTTYWPLSGKVQFFATAPSQTLTVPASGYPTFSYTIANSDGTSQEDLVAANEIDKDKNGGDVNFVLKHLLTQVNFSIKGETEGFTYTVTNVVIKGVKNQATFKFDGTATVGGWNNLSGSGEYTHSIQHTVAPTTADKEQTTNFETANNALFMLIPQTLSGATLEITYKAAPTDAPTAYTFDNTKTLNLTGNWDMGHSVRYTLSLSNDASPIKLGYKVDAWGADEAGTAETPSPAA